MIDANISKISSLLKKTYSDKIIEYMPKSTTFQSLIKFTKTDIGESYNWPIQTGSEQGFTYAGANAGQIQYNDAIGLETAGGTITPCQTWLRSQITDEELARVAKSGQGASCSILSTKMKGFTESFRFRLELAVLYGGSPLGVVESVDGNTVVIAAAHWASDIWHGLQNAKMSVYVGSTSIQRTDVHIRGIDSDTHTILVDNATGIAAGDSFYAFGSYGKSMTGIHKVLTTTDSLYGIDISKNSALRSTQYAVGGELTREHINRAVNRAQARGLKSGDMTLFVAPQVWTDLMDAESSLRRHTGDGGTFENGASYINFNTSAGTVKVTANSLVKTGFGYIIDDSAFKRVGAYDIKMGGPYDGESVLQKSLTSNIYQIIGYSNQTLVCERPGASILLTGITTTF